MLHKAWNSKGEVPYCFPRSSIKFQGHTGQNITDFDPNWAFPDCRPVAAFKSLRFALLSLYYNTVTGPIMPEASRYGKQVSFKKEVGVMVIDLVFWLTVCLILKMCY